MLSALDLLRRLGWAVIDFIYKLVDTLFREIDQYLESLDEESLC